MAIDGWTYILGDTGPANDLVLRHHYSRRPPAPPVLCATAHRSFGCLLHDAEAACMFSHGMSTWQAKHPGLVELIRLVRVPGCDLPLSSLVAFATRHLKQLRRFDLAFSYADVREGHHGGIYQACSWHYAGRTKPTGSGCMLAGEFIPSWSMTDRFGTKAAGRIEEMTGHRPVTVMTQGKHLYWRALNRRGVCLAQQLWGEPVQYPRPGDDG